MDRLVFVTYYLHTHLLVKGRCSLSDAEVVTGCSVAAVQGPILLPKYRVKSFLMPGGSLETLVDVQLYNHVRSGLVTLLGARTYFASKVLTPYCYTLGSYLSRCIALACRLTLLYG